MKLSFVILFQHKLFGIRKNKGHTLQLNGDELKLVFEYLNEFSGPIDRTFYDCFKFNKMQIILILDKINKKKYFPIDQDYEYIFVVQYVDDSYETNDKYVYTISAQDKISRINFNEFILNKDQVFYYLDRLNVNEGHRFDKKEIIYLKKYLIQTFPFYFNFHKYFYTLRMEYLNKYFFEYRDLIDNYKLN